MIKVERGKVLSLKDMIEGNSEKNLEPNKEFINELNKFPKLKETALGIEGLIVQRGVHASGILVLNDDVTKYNAVMKSPKGEITTQFELHNSEAMGGLKYDLLLTNQMSLLRITMNNLIKDNKMQWQGNLRATYNKYLHPNILEYDDFKMWQIIDKIPSLFQFETEVGSQAIKKVQPKSVIDLTVANSLMRLMGTSGKELPLDTYVRYKKDIDEWYKDMQNYGLNNNEINVLKSYLLPSYGLADSQEKVMLLSMDKHISGFSLGESNKLRKSIAKKRPDILEKTKNIFFDKGKKLGVREVFLNYVWYEIFGASFGYSFSSIHAYNYSIGGLQDMNLYYKYNPIYWDTSVLTVDASANEDSENNKSTNYGKTAAAIGKMQHKGVHIALPSINQAGFSFKPDAENDQIIFGMKGINGINDETVNEIIQNRPYKSFTDFLNRMIYCNEAKVTQAQVVKLIKAGCFDELLEDNNKTRKELMKYYIRKITDTKTKLNFQNMPMLIKYNCISEKYNIYQRYYKYKKYIYNKKFFYKKDDKFKTKKHYIIEEKFALPFFQQYFMSDMIEGKQYYYNENGKLIIIDKEFDKVYDKKMEKFKKYLTNNKKLLSCLNQKLIQENINKYAKGNTSKWEMDALSFYYGDHELKNIDTIKYNIQDFNKIPEEPIIIGEKINKNTGKHYKKYQLYKIAGTVLDKKKNKHLITLLTTTGVVNVKFYAGAFSHYDKQISTYDDKGNKKVIEKSWFTKGNLLIITGFRREDQFVPRKYKNSIYQHTVVLITDILQNGELKLQLERKQI